jgi:hypothetical protein
MDRLPSPVEASAAATSGITYDRDKMMQIMKSGMIPMWIHPKQAQQLVGVNWALPH